MGSRGKMGTRLCAGFRLPNDQLVYAEVPFQPDAVQDYVPAAAAHCSF
jgi:hypothetical protein